MSILKGFFDKERAEDTKFTPKPNVPRSNTQAAVEYIADNAGNVGQVYAPTDAEYLTKSITAGLDNERVVTDSPTIEWDWSETGKAKANWQHLGMQLLSDPGEDRGMFWDDSEGAVKWFNAGTGLGFSGEYLSITDPNLTAIHDMRGHFAQGDILFYDGEKLNRLPAGTADYVLRTKGPGQNPAWEVVDVEASEQAAAASALAAQQAQAAAEQAQAAAEQAQLGAEAAEDGAEDALSYAIEWANNDEDDPVSSAAGGDGATTFSAKHWAAKAQAAAGSVGNPVPKSLFDANTILKADADDTPVALTVGEGTLVGRKTGGSIAALNASEVKALLDIEVGVDVQAYSANLDSWSAVAPSGYYTKTEADAAFQPLDSDLTAIAVLSTQPYGRSLLTAANEVGFKQLVNLEIGVDVQAYSANLDAWSSEDPEDYYTSAEIDAAFQPLDGDLTAIAALSSTGIAVRTASNTWAQRTITGTANQIEVTNGDGVSGNPTLSLHTGVYRAGGTDVALADGGTGASLSDPGADRIMFWDDSASHVTWLSLGTGLSISGTELQLGALLQAISQLSAADGNFIVGNGSTFVAESGATARTSLGLGTSDSPQFTGVNIGHASDTTLTRLSAGVVGVEGTALLRASQNLSDVANAVTARVNLKFVDLTQAEYDALSPPDSETYYFITDAE